MRLELALILGIIFFCSWCAYIVIKMNSSVPPTLGASLEAQNYSGHEQDELSQERQAHNNQYILQAKQQQQQQLQHQRLADANSPAVYFVGPQQQQQQQQQHYQTYQQYQQQRPASLEHATLAQVQQQRPTYSRQLTASVPSRDYSSSYALNRWQPPRAGHYSTLLPHHSAPAVPASQQPAAASLNQPPVAQLGPLVAQPQQQQLPVNYGAVQTTTGAELEPDQAVEQVAGETEEPEEEEEEEGQANGEPKLKGQELEEKSGERAYSEDDEQESERDRHGRPTNVRRRHLINGKPVEPSAGDRQRPSSDFEEVVDEIEDSSIQPEQVEGEEEQQRPSPVQIEDGEAPGESSPPGSLVLNPLSVGNSSNSTHSNGDGLVGKTILNPAYPARQIKETTKGNALSLNKTQEAQEEGEADEYEEQDDTASDKLDEIGEGKAGEQLPKSKRDSHEHQLRESLRSQQWDDDDISANKDTNGTSNAASIDYGGIHHANGPGDGGQGETSDQQEPASSIGDDKDEIEFMDLDLLTSVAKFPFMDNEANESNSAETQVSASSSNRPNLLARADRKRRDLSQVANLSSLDLHRANKTTTTTPHKLDQLQQETEAQVRKHVVDLIAGPQDVSLTLLPAPVVPLAANQSHLAILTGPANLPGQSQDAPLVATYAADGGPLPVSILDANGPVSSSDANGHLSRPSTGLSQAQFQQNGSQVLDHSSAVDQFYGPQQSLEPQLAQLSPSSSKSKKKKIKKKATKKKKKKKKSESKMAESKYKAAKAHSSKKKSKLKKGGRVKKKKKAMKKLANKKKEFKGNTKGAKMAKGRGAKGAKKGALHYKDKGYKKKGFKRAYQKVESGDHKIYFDEFRDKDHKKKWKNFKDKHEYSQSKKWAGKDRKKYNNFDLSELKDKKSGSGSWAEKAHSKYRKDYKHKSSKAKKSASKSKKKKKKKSKSWEEKKVDDLYH